MGVERPIEEGARSRPTLVNESFLTSDKQGGRDSLRAADPNSSTNFSKRRSKSRRRRLLCLASESPVFAEGLSPSSSPPPLPPLRPSLARRRDAKGLFLSPSCLQKGEKGTVSSRKHVQRRRNVAF